MDVVDNRTLDEGMERGQSPWCDERPAKPTLTTVRFSPKSLHAAASGNEHEIALRKVSITASATIAQPEFSFFTAQTISNRASRTRGSLQDCSTENVRYGYSNRSAPNKAP